MAILGKEKYSQERLNKLYQYVKTYAERGNPVDYEIVVDNFKAVRRTDDPELFYMYEDFVGPATKGIEVIIYSGTSNNNDKYIFNFEENDNALNGLEVENRIKEHVSQERQKWDYEQLKKDCEEWKEYAKELEEDVDKLEKQLEEIRADQSPLHGILGEFGSSLVSGLVKHNPKVLEKIPGLAGLVEEGKKEISSGEQEAQTFTPSKDEPENAEAKDALAFIKYLRRKFNQDQFNKVMVIVDKLTQKPEKIEEILTQLNG